MTKDTIVSQFTEETSVLYNDRVPFISDPSGSPKARIAPINNFLSGPEIKVVASNAPANWKKHADYVCDGTADDVQIQAAIDGMLASYQGSVRLSPGLFNCSSTISIADNAHVTLQGAGAMSTRINFTVAGHCINIGDALDSGTQGAMLREFRITGDAVNTTYGVYCNNLAYCHFQDLFIEYMTEYGFYLTSSSQCYLKNLRCKECVTACFYLSQVAGGVMNCVAHGTTSGDGFYILSSGTAYIGCTVDHVGGIAYKIVGNADGVSLLGCYTEGSVSYALYIDKGSGSYVHSTSVFGGVYSLHAGTTADAVCYIGDADLVTLVGVLLATTDAVAGIKTAGAATDYVRVINPYHQGTSPQYSLAADTRIVIDDPLYTTPVVAFTADDATPSVLGRNFFKTANANPTTITTFDGGYNGQQITVIINDDNTIIDFSSSTLKGSGGVDFHPLTGDFLTAIYDGTNWYCSVNAVTQVGGRWNA